MTGSEIRPVKVPIFVMREQLEQLKGLAARQGLGITAYIQSIVSNHLFMNAPDYQDHVVDALELHRTLAAIACYNDAIIERSLKKSSAVLSVGERLRLDDELQQQLRLSVVPGAESA